MSIAKSEKTRVYSRIKTILATYAWIGAVLPLFASEAHAFAKHPPVPKYKRFAFVASNYGDAGFNGEADQVLARLRSLGWETYKVGQDPSDQVANGPRVAAIIQREALARARIGDEVLIDVQAHGAVGERTFEYTNPDGTQGTFRGNYFEALAHGNLSETLKYPYEDASVWRTHWVDAFVPRGAWGLDAQELSDVAGELRSRGVRVSVIDHSCNGGATVKLLEQKDPTVCAVGTAGQLSPGLVGWPNISSRISSGLTMDALADWISTSYYNGAHKQGGRVFSIGYKTGCTQTLPLRETADAASYGYGTWWDWVRSSRGHLLREPSRYSNPATAEPTMLFSGAEPNPRLKMPAALQRWFLETLNKFYAENQFASEALGQSGSAINSVTAIYQSGLRLQTAATSYRRAFEVLEQALAESRVPGTTQRVDEKLRYDFVRNCLCKVPAVVSQWALDCSGLETGTGNLWNPSLSSSYCINPKPYVDAIVASVPAVSAAKSALAAREAETIRFLIEFSSSVQNYEKSCRAASCVTEIF